MISINGQLSPPYIPTTDRGLLFGESVYEVIAVYDQKPFQLHLHLKRLANSFYKLYRIDLELTSIKQWVFDFINSTPKAPAMAIYIQVSTGPMEIRAHIHTKQKPLCIIQQTEYVPIDLNQYKKGFKAITAPDLRSSLAQHKTNQLALNTLALNRAHEEGYDDAVFIKDNQIVEGASSNVFAYDGNTLITPPLGDIVPGITRKLILQIAQQKQIVVQTKPIKICDLKNYSEIFLSSSTKLLKPIIEIKDIYLQPKPGPIWQSLMKTYLQKTTCSLLKSDF